MLPVRRCFLSAFDEATSFERESDLAIDPQSPSDATPPSPHDTFVSALVERALAKLVAGEIGLDEAASRLVGTGRFDENQAALDHIRGEVFPKLDERLRQLEEDISQKLIEAERLRLLLGRESGLSTHAASLLGGVSQAAPSTGLSGHEKSRKKGGAQAPEKKKRGFGFAEDEPPTGPLSQPSPESGLSEPPVDLASSVWDGP